MAYYNLLTHLFPKKFLGADPIRPWGFAHKKFWGLANLEEETRERFINLVRPRIESDTETRIKYLEDFSDFIKENIINISLLIEEIKTIEKKNLREKEIKCEM